MPVANKRLANRVMWALEDIDQAAINALAMWDKAVARAELKCMDPALLLALSRIRSELGDIRILATAARAGEYAGKKRVIYEPEEEVA